MEGVDAKLFRDTAVCVQALESALKFVGHVYNIALIE